MPLHNTTCSQNYIGDETKAESLAQDPDFIQAIQNTTLESMAVLKLSNDARDDRNELKLITAPKNASKEELKAIVMESTKETRARVAKMRFPTLNETDIFHEIAVRGTAAEPKSKKRRAEEAAALNKKARDSKEDEGILIEDKNDNTATATDADTAAANLANEVQSDAIAIEKKDSTATATNVANVSSEVPSVGDAIAIEEYSGNAATECKNGDTEVDSDEDRLSLVDTETVEIEDPKVPVISGVNQQRTLKLRIGKYLYCHPRHMKQLTSIVRETKNATQADLSSVLDSLKLVVTVTDEVALLNMKDSYSHCTSSSGYCCFILLHQLQMLKHHKDNKDQYSIMSLQEQLNYYNIDISKDEHRTLLMKRLYEYRDAFHSIENKHKINKKTFETIHRKRIEEVIEFAKYNPGKPLLFYI